VIRFGVDCGGKRVCNKCNFYFVIFSVVLQVVN
jgi:hypothetical protein